MKRAALMTAALAPLLIASGLATAADLPGSFPGVTIDAKLIGGQEYEPLYARIAEWEKLTGAKVNILSKKNDFDLDKEFKSDIAANTINWCVGSNHTSFAPQYTKPLHRPVETDSEGGDRQIRPAHHQGLDHQRQARNAAAGEIRRLRALLSQEQLHRRRQEEGVQGQIRLRPRAADDLAAGEGPGDLFRQPAELLRHRVRRQGGGDQRALLRDGRRRGRRVSRRQGQARLQFGRGRARAQLVRRSLQGQGRAARHHQLSLGRSRPGLRLGHGRARSRLAGLGDLLQRSEVLEGRRQCRHHRPAGRFVRQAHRLVRHATASRSPKPASTRTPRRRSSGG